jgi:hypothetical protein
MILFGSNLSLTPIPSGPKWSLLLASQLDVRLHQDGHGHKPLPVEGLTRTRKDGQCLTRIEPDLVPLMELTLSGRSFNSN